MKHKTHQYWLFFLLCAAGILAGCRQEFFPPELGEPIPAATFPELLETLPETGYGTFRVIWERSNVKQLIADEYVKSDLTYLIPDDAAFANAGYTSASVNGMAAADLDTLLLAHIVPGALHVARLPTGSTLALNSLLSIPDIAITTARVSGQDQIARPYVFQHHLFKTADGIMSNGTALVVNDEADIRNGRMVLIDKLIPYAKKQMIDIMREDDRFSLFLAAADLNIAIRIPVYETYSTLNNSVYLDRARYEYHYIPPGGAVPANRLISLAQFTLFLPTNEAFHQVGIYTEADILALSQRADLDEVATAPRAQQRTAKTALEKVFHLHTLRGASTSNFTLNYELANRPVYVEITNSFNNVTASPFFFQHDLRPDVSQTTELRPYVVGQQSGRVTVQAASSAYPPATITESLMTLQGPVHVVDRLIIEEGVEL
ncbi:fasciclin domain-containing protein [Parapedobacter composti]|nr:fasciclin domain-containing protein [Parapedobacter composti]